jgi:hypothetical protein
MSRIDRKWRSVIRLASAWAAAPRKQRSYTDRLGERVKSTLSGSSGEPVVGPHSDALWKFAVIEAQSTQSQLMRDRGPPGKPGRDG